VTPRRPSVRWLLVVGSLVAVATGVYAGVHEPAGRPFATLGFSGMLQMKAWLTTAAALLLVVQLLTALWMWGRLPGAGRAPAWAAPVHRTSGAVAFALTLPVALHCMWALGFSSGSPRVLVHGLAACLFYGAYAAKMLGLRLRGLPGWALPVLGGAAGWLFGAWNDYLPKIAVGIVLLPALALGARLTVADVRHRHLGRQARPHVGRRQAHRGRGLGECGQRTAADADEVERAHELGADREPRKVDPVHVPSPQ